MSDIEAQRADRLYDLWQEAVTSIAMYNVAVYLGDDTAAIEHAYGELLVHESPQDLAYLIGQILAAQTGPGSVQALVYQTITDLVVLA